MMVIIKYLLLKPEQAILHTIKYLFPTLTYTHRIEQVYYIFSIYSKTNLVLPKTTSNQSPFARRTFNSKCRTLLQCNGLVVKCYTMSTLQL
ncbi:hypothetical protein FKM82_001891 [Ascaphus truei]